MQTWLAVRGPDMCKDVLSVERLRSLSYGLINILNVVNGDHQKPCAEHEPGRLGNSCRAYCAVN